MVYTPGGFTNNIPMEVDASSNAKNYSTRKPLCQYYELFDVKHKISA